MLNRILHILAYSARMLMFVYIRLPPRSFEITLAILELMTNFQILVSAVVTASSMSSMKKSKSDLQRVPTPIFAKEIIYVDGALVNVSRKMSNS